MVTARSRQPGAGLLRAALLGAILAVLTGLLGMHVFAGTPGAHRSAEHSTAEAVPGHPSSGHAASGHPAFGHAASSHAAPGHAAPGHAGAVTLHETPAPPSCVGGGGCGEQHIAHVSCTPAPSAASLGAPPPGSTLVAAQPRTSPAADPATAYSYLPATPTPSELSISRT